MNINFKYIFLKPNTFISFKKYIIYINNYNLKISSQNCVYQGL